MRAPPQPTTTFKASSIVAHKFSPNAKHIGFAVAAAGLLAGGAWAVWWIWSTPTLAEIAHSAQLGRRDEAESAMETYLRRFPRDASGLLLAARLAADRSDWARTIALLDRVPPDSQLGLTALVQKAMALRETRALSRTEQAWREVLGASERDRDADLYRRTAQAELVSLLSLERRAVEARELIWQMLPDHPEKWRLLITLARLQAKTVDPEVAIEQLRPCVDAHPDDFVARRALAQYLADAARWDAAETEAKACLAQHAGDPQTLEILLQCLLARQQWKAMAAILADSNLDRCRAAVWRVEAQFRDGSGDASAAESCYAAALERGQFDPTVHFQYAQWLVRRGERDRAEQHLDRFNRLREHERAIEQFLDRVIKSDPQQWKTPAAATCVTLAEHCQALGRMDEARAWLEETSRQQPGKVTGSN